MYMAEQHPKLGVSIFVDCVMEIRERITDIGVLEEK